MNPLLAYLDADDSLLEAQWHRLQAWVAERFGKEPGIEEILFLVGIQSQGRGFEPDLDKEAKQSLVMEGTYCVFETLGVYERIGMEKDGHWIWERRLDHPPNLSVDEQEKLLRTAILRYFEDMLNPAEAHEA
jgi:hypothetical protein